MKTKLLTISLCALGFTAQANAASRTVECSVQKIRNASYLGTKSFSSPDSAILPLENWPSAQKQTVSADDLEIRFGYGLMPVPVSSNDRDGATFEESLAVVWATKGKLDTMDQNSISVPIAAKPGRVFEMSLKSNTLMIFCDSFGPKASR